MSGPAIPMTGACRCGQVRFRVDAPPLLTMACHCTGCQRMSSSAYSLSVAVPAEAFVVTDGGPVVGGLHGFPTHYFCPHCMSWMFTRIEGAPFVNVRATLLDDVGWFTPFIETYTSEKLPWASVPATHSFPQFPEFSAYEGLFGEYAGQRQGS
jgi:hypothetical protein